MTTTIQIGDDIREKLEKMKLSGRDTYNDVLERIIEDLAEIDEDTKKEIEIARKQIKSGKFKTHEEVKKEFGVK